MRLIVIVLGLAAMTTAAPAPDALALNPVKPVCGVAGFVSGAAGKACKVVQEPGRVLKAGKKLIGGHVVGAGKALFGGDGGSSSSNSSSNARAATLVGLAAIGAWVLGGAKFAMHETGKVLSQTTSPQLRATWFSSAYWRMAAIATVLTLPFLLAAVVQALIRSDISLIARAAFGYLPLAMLIVGIAAPLTMLLLVVSDQVSSTVSAAAGNASETFLTHTALVVGALTLISPFIAFLIGLFTAAAAFMLWLELLVREAAVYVIVLMLPLAFAALVWPARRIWAVRAVELLVALILSKFAIVAVLSLGGAALGTSISAHSVTGALAGGALVLLAVFAPWALLRLLPLAELASGAAGSLRHQIVGHGQQAFAMADGGAGGAESLLTRMREHSRAVTEGAPEEDPREASQDHARPALQPPASASADEQPAADRASAAKVDEEAPAVPASADHDADADAYTTAPADGAEQAQRRDKERLPGMEPRWQEENFAWPPLELDADHLMPADPRANPLEPGRDDEGPARNDKRADEPDPRPSEQPPLEGRL